MVLNHRLALKQNTLFLNDLLWKWVTYANRGDVERIQNLQEWHVAQVSEYTIQLICGSFKIISYIIIIIIIKLYFTKVHFTS